MTHGLQSAREHDVVEGAVVEPRQSLFQIALDDIDAIGDRRQHAGILEFDAITMGAALLAQSPEQRAVAAAKVEHPLAGPDPAGDQIEIGASARIDRDIHKTIRRK
jgi:hypothetical protein